MDKDLKIFALEYVKLHDDLLKEEKLALGDFVMEASDDQVKFMLFTGEVKHNLTEEDLLFLKEDPNYDAGFTHGKLTGTQSGFIGGLAAAAYVALIAKASYSLYKQYLSKAAKACKETAGTAKVDCMAKYKKKAQEQKVKKLESGIGQCSKTKNPQKCKEKLQQKIRKEKAKMGAL